VGESVESRAWKLKKERFFFSTLAKEGVLSVECRVSGDDIEEWCVNEWVTMGGNGMGDDDLNEDQRREKRGILIAIDTFQNTMQKKKKKKKKKKGVLTTTKERRKSH